MNARTRLVGALALLAAGALHADDRDPLRPHPPVVLPGSEIRFFQSKRTDVGYKLYIAPPKSYDAKPAARFPLIVTLDADYSFALARNIVEHLADRNGLPDALVVSIAYAEDPAYRMHRTRDYTPTRSLVGYAREVQEHSGGAAKFLACLTEEVLPFLRARYRIAKDDATLVGHSYGGLFATYALAEAAPFARYVIVSPSLWYDEGWIFRTYPKLGARAPRRVYVAIGSEEEGQKWKMVSDVKKLGERLRANGVPAAALKIDVLPEEAHDTIFPGALTRGLRFVFAE